VPAAGNTSSNSPLDFFEKSIRLIEESRGPLPDLKIDELLEFSEAEMGRIFDALQKSYPENHWAVARTSFRHVIEAAMQLVRSHRERAFFITLYS